VLTWPAHIVEQDDNNRAAPQFLNHRGGLRGV
jgi:hypothetical protein